ncbi:MAG: rhomboid family intramembrane serine protease [Micrococcaceae bacterium]
MSTEHGTELKTWEKFGRFTLPIGLVAVMWVIQIINMTGWLNKLLGLRARKVSSLFDIFTFPFVHANLAHIIGNSIPLLILGCVIALGGTKIYAQVTALIITISGSMLWIVGPSYTITIGASGLVFGYITYLVGRAYFFKSGFLKIGYMAIAIIVTIFYGFVLIGGITPMVRSGISWQAHLCGAIAGILTAKILSTGKLSNEHKRALERESELDWT